MILLYKMKRIKSLSDYKTLFSENNGHFVMIFSSDSCGPCKQLLSTLKNIKSKQIAVVKLEDFPSLFQKYQIYGVPTVIKIFPASSGYESKQLSINGYTPLIDIQKILRTEGITYESYSNDAERKNTYTDALIIGGGPAGWTAAIYLANALFKPIVLTGKKEYGGQLYSSTHVDNFPGYPDATTGEVIIENMKTQAKNLGAISIHADAVEVDLHHSPFMVRLDNNQIIFTKSIILATGSKPRKLDIPGAEKYWLKGISSCAKCDGNLPMFKNQNILVVGGGDSACEEALYMTKFAEHVILAVRSDRLRASKKAQEKVLKNEKITVAFDTEVIEMKGDLKQLTSVVLKVNKANKINNLDCRGVFYAIGSDPNTSLFAEQLRLTDTGHVYVDNDTNTSIPGVFACGDLVDNVYKQAITSAGSGCKAAINAIKYLE